MKYIVINPIFQEEPIVIDNKEVIKQLDEIGNTKVIRKQEFLVSDKGTNIRLRVEEIKENEVYLSLV